MFRRVVLALLVLATLVLSACSQTGFVIDKLNGNGDVCIPKYDVNGNDLNECGVEQTSEEEQADELSDLDDLLAEIEKDMDTNDSVVDTTSKDEVIETESDKEDVSETVVPVEDSTGLLVKEVVEGELVELKPRVTDPDGDPIKLEFSEPLDENGQWYTKEGDAGVYVVTVKADDGQSVSEQKVKIIVDAKNKAPVIVIGDELRFAEGDKIVLEPEVSDPEGEPVTVSYSGWMNSDSYQTSYDDAGTYSVTILASDGNRESSKKLKIVVDNANRAPVIQKMPKLSVLEGNELVLNPVVSDLDGDNVEVTFEEPFDSNGKWQTAEGDAGEYKTTVVASDGDKSAKLSVDIVVESLNKAPVLQQIKDINVNEGEEVVISPLAIDPEGEPVSFEYSGWMTTSSYLTNYNDAGTHTVTVTVSDGVYSDSQDVTVIVEDVNRAPVITWG
ncbi:PKD domain-containing protein [Candidatus Woesearchaeota archaeon]|nr:PKD domain-containing protein [Candidatus Woesearchaeota archaeon]